MWEEFDEKSLGGKVYRVQLYIIKTNYINTWTMFSPDCYFHMYCLTWQLAYLSYFID